MRNRLPLLAVLLLLATTLPRAIAQETPKSQTAKKAQDPKDPRHFDATKTGDIIDLGPNWLFQTGDNPAWAAADFDDSKWPVITAKKTLAEQGYKNVNNIWYRAHVKVPPGSGALMLGDTALIGSYEIFVNGVRIGGEGGMAGRGTGHGGGLIYYGIPKEAVHSGELAIAIHCVVGTEMDQAGRGGIIAGTRILMGGPVGLAPLAYVSYIRGPSLNWLFLVTVFVVVVVVLALYRVLPEQKEYLVIALCGAFNLLGESMEVIAARYRLPESGVVLTIRTLAAYATYALQYDVVLRLVGVRPGRWIRVLQILLMGAAVYELVNARALLSPLPVSEILNDVARIGLNVTVPVYLFLEMRRGNRDAPVLFAFQIVSSVLYTLSDTGVFLYQTHLVRTNYAPKPLPIGPFRFDLPDIALLYFWVTLLIIILLRTVRTTRESAEIAGEIAAARSVQQVLIPDFLEPVPGLTVESAYIPAQEVGGDFFQVLPIAEGAAFIVVGDVSGKGLKAAMTVSLIVGTLRTYAEFYTSPAQLLAGMNRRLHGRTAGFATCLALMITREGEVTIANAGHPNPYLDGIEIQTDSNLPLGITLDLEYTETRLHIDPAQSLTLVTDGVIEATAAATKELFGFDRTQAISRQAANAIAEAARAFGLGAPQADDITVLTVARA
jgi:hypothetical protein